MIKYIFFLLLIGGGSYFLYLNKEQIQSYISKPQPTDVLVLSDSSFDQVISDNEYVLVKFYAPWCGHCKSLAPEYETAATTLKEQGKNIVLAKVDATVQKGLASKYEIKGFPTLLFFNKGEKIEYNGGRTSQLILRWVDKRTGNFSNLVESIEQYEQFKTSNNVLITLYVENEQAPQWEQFKLYGINNEKYSFSHTFSQSVAAELKIKSGQLAIYTQSNDQTTIYTGSLDSETLDQELLSLRIPLSLKFGDQYIDLIFQSSLPTVHIFLQDSITSEEQLLIEEVSQIYKTKKQNVIFSYISQSEGGHYEKLVEFLGAQKDVFPQVIISGIDGRKINKYPMVQSFNKQNLQTFVQNYLDGQLKPALKSEAVPTNNNDPVKIIVGKNFQDEVINNDKDVLVKYYAAWCGHCKNLAPHWDAAAEALIGNKNIVIAKMDATLNEVEGLDIQSFPTIKFYPGNDKSNVINYTGERNKDGIINWLEKNTTHLWVPLSGQEINQEANNFESQQKNSDL